MSDIAVVNVEGVGLTYDAAKRSPYTCFEVAYVPEGLSVRENPVK